MKRPPRSSGQQPANHQKHTTLHSRTSYSSRCQCQTWTPRSRRCEANCHDFSTRARAGATPPRSSSSRTAKGSTWARSMRMDCRRAMERFISRIGNSWNHCSRGAGPMASAGCSSLITLIMRGMWPMTGRMDRASTPKWIQGISIKVSGRIISPMERALNIALGSSFTRGSSKTSGNTILGRSIWKMGTATLDRSMMTNSRAKGSTGTRTGISTRAAGRTAAWTARESTAGPTETSTQADTATDSGKGKAVSRRAASISKATGKKDSGRASAHSRRRTRRSSASGRAECPYRPSDYSSWRIKRPMRNSGSNSFCSRCREDSGSPATPWRARPWGWSMSGWTSCRTRARGKSHRRSHNGSD
jgi:hypothetical protein